MTKLVQLAAIEIFNRMTQRDRAIETARPLYKMGHRKDVVRALVAEARMCNHRIIQCKRRLKS